MKRVSLIVLVFLTCHITYGQETKPVIKRSVNVREEFNVLTTDKKVKHGPYKRYEGKDRLIAEGAYDHNTKVGEWKFFVNGELEQSYDFNTKELTYSKKSDVPSKVFMNGTTQQIRLDSQPTYIGSKPGLTEELNKRMTYPMQALRMGVEGKVLTSVWVSEEGKISEIKIVKGIMSECDKEVVKGLNSVENNWIPGKKGGESMKAELLIVIEFKLHPNGDKTITAL